MTTTDAANLTRLAARGIRKATAAGKPASVAAEYGAVYATEHYYGVIAAPKYLPAVRDLIAGK